MPNIDIEDTVDQDMWDYTNKYNEWEGGGGDSGTMTKPNRIEC